MLGWEGVEGWPTPAVLLGRPCSRIPRPRAPLHDGTLSPGSAVAGGAGSCSAVLGSLPEPNSLPTAANPSAFTRLFTYLFNRSS